MTQPGDEHAEEVRDEPAESLHGGPAGPAGPADATGPARTDGPGDAQVVDEEGEPIAEVTGPSDVEQGEATESAEPTETAEDSADVDEASQLRKELAERTADLQRLQAEFLNYKRRVDRDRELIRENAMFRVLGPIIDVLDTIDRAREHGPLEDGFRAVADQLERAVQGLGLVRFGEVGETFDPNRHEALTHLGEDPEVEVTTCRVVAKAGYRIGDRVVRAAQVLVVDPAGG